MQRGGSTNVANTDAYRFPAEWGTSESSWPAPTATIVPTVALGKRQREAEEPHGNGDPGPVGVDTSEIPPPKRARGSGATSGNLKAARSAARTRHKPEARNPIYRISGKPKEAGRGAERLATPNAQGIYHRSLLGPLQQGWVEEAANGTLIWVEGRVDETVVQHSDGAVQQQQQQQQDEEENKRNMVRIPKKFKSVHRALLKDLKDDMVPEEIRCRLCPDTKLKSLEEFKRHCETNEAHPLRLSFCDTCGDHFARADSLGRHRKKPPPECKMVKPEKAAEKRRETQLAHNEFLEMLEECLRTGGDIVPFSQIIKGKYPESSKKRISGRRR